jgi:DegV family protein with EDD domain
MSKLKVAIVTDSTCNLPVELVEEYGLHVIPQVLIWDGATLRDGVDITVADFYQRLATSESVPTTSQASAGQFVEFFSEVAKTAESIVAILISDELSGTLDSARAAKDMMEGTPIEIVDSRSTAMGLGFVVLTAARAARQGLSAAEVADVARAVVPKVKVMFVVDTLEYLHRGGRIGGARRLLGSMLSVKPLLHLVDGRIEALENVRTKKKAVARLLELAVADVAGQPVRAAVMDAVAPQEAEQISRSVQELMKPLEIIRSELTPVIGAHVGPGTVGVVYFVE